MSRLNDAKNATMFDLYIAIFFGRLYNICIYCQIVLNYGYNVYKSILFEQI